MIDHMSLFVRNPSASRAFYEKALAPLGYSVVAEYGPLLALGACDETGRVHPEIWLVPEEAPPRSHLALTAASTDEVEAFYQAALAVGGTDNGAPGERPHYHPGYYGAFVLDPDGNNIEAVCHKGPVGQKEA